MIAPLLLGDAAYDLLVESGWDDWYSFQETVEARFGLSKRQILDAFFAMKPEPGEGEAQFLLRVEDFRRKYK